jgi:hypothetical protein
MATSKKQVLHPVGEVKTGYIGLAREVVKERVEKERLKLERAEERK